jgi:hypothetical protein
MRMRTRERGTGMMGLRREIRRWVELELEGM